jgi:hypothetical protein
LNWIEFTGGNIHSGHPGATASVPDDSSCEPEPRSKTLRQFGWLCLIVFGGVAIAGFSKSGLNSFTIAWAVAGLLGGACGWLRPRTAEMGVCDVDHPCVSNRLDSQQCNT